MKQNLFILLLLLICSGKVKSQTYTSSSSVSAIPGEDCLYTGTPGNSVINVSSSGTIGTVSDVFIHVNLTASCLPALKLALVAPDGDSCILLNRPFRDGPCSGSCYYTEDTNTLSFNATYSAPIPQIAPVPTGNYAPTGSTFAPQVGDLNTFLAGKAINGNWTLTAGTDAGMIATISSWSIVFGSTALPLDLLSLSGHAHAGCNELKWSTAGEQHTASFDIQRTVDGVTYQTIGEVSAKGFGDNQYSFRDLDYTSEVNLYRLRIIDISGAYTYSKTVKISGNMDKDAGMNFVPNPVKDVFNLTIINKDLLYTEGDIINSLGQIVYTFKVEQEKVRGNIAHLPAGIYFLRLNDGRHYRFVKEF